MAFDVLKGVDKAVTFTPDAVWSSPTCEVYKPSSATAVATPSATVSSVNTTIAAVTDAKTFAITSASGVSQGHSYLVTGDGWTAVCKVADLTSTSVVLETALPEAPGVGDAFQGIEITATITAATLSEYGTNWRVLVKENQTELVQTFNVVRHLFREPVTEQDCRDLVNEVWRSAEFPAGAYATIAGKASQKVRAKLLASGRYPHLMGDPDAFKEAGRSACRLVLVDRGLIGPGWDVREYIEFYEDKLDRDVGEVVQSLSAYDSDDDDVLSDEAEYIHNMRWVL